VPVAERGPVYNPERAHSIFTHTGWLARADRTNYVAPIKAFWRAYELKLYEDQEKVIEPEILRLYKENPVASAKFATEYTIAVCDRAFRVAEKIHDALVAHIAAAPNTLFKIPAELLEPTVNDTVLRIPTDEDKKAIGEYNLLTRDDGNIQVSPVSANDAPAINGYKFNLPGKTVDIALKPEQVAANQKAAKLLYEVEFDNAFVKAYGGLDFLKKNLTFVMSVDGKGLKLVGPEGALISFPDALSKGIATLTMTSDGVIVGIEYILVDGAGKSGIFNNKMIVFDEVADGVLKDSIWAATPTSKLPVDESGCNSGLGFAALGLFTILTLVRKRSK
jgi:hypothetical protein